jgi:PAS domain-containing protein
VAQQSIELILFRQLAASLAIPAFLVDAEGSLVFLNEPAEVLTGVRFDEMDRMPLAAWVAAVRPRSPDGADLVDEEGPLRRALLGRVPGHQAVMIVAADGTDRTIQVTAFPLLGQGGRILGAVAMFWEHLAS